MLEVTKGKVKQPVLMVLYGVESVGKTEFATKFPDPLFIDFEGGSERYDVARIRPKNYWDLKKWLSDEKNLAGYKTLVIDSLDWLERSIHEALCEKAKVAQIEELAGYGKWVSIVLNECSSFVDLLKSIREKTKVNIVMTAHYKIKTFNDPLTATPYDRYQMKLADNFSALIREWVDMVLFANFETYSKVNSSSDKKGKGVGHGARIIFTEKRPSHDAKNRFSLPYQMPVDYNQLMNLVDSSREDLIKNIIQEINDILMDMTDTKTAETARSFVENNKTNLDALKATKNRLITLTGGN